MPSFFVAPFHIMRDNLLFQGGNKMSDSVIPNTETMNIAILAIAWEIVKTTPDYFNTKMSQEDKLKALTNAVIKAQQAMFNFKPIE